MWPFRPDWVVLVCYASLNVVDFLVNQMTNDEHSHQYVSHKWITLVCVGNGISILYYVTFWHSKAKTNTFIKYHTPVYDWKYAIKKHQYNGKNNDKHHSKNHKFHRKMIQSSIETFPVPTICHIIVIAVLFC